MIAPNSPSTAEDSAPDSARALPEMYWQQWRPRRWVWRRWPMLVPFAVAIVCITIVLDRAWLPELIPGPRDLPQAVRDRAGLLWMLCWLPALGYTLAPPGRRRPIPFLPIIGVLYGLYYALSPALGVTNFWSRDPETGAAMTAIFDPATDYTHPVNLALAGWLACLCGYGTLSMLWRRAATRLRHGPPLYHPMTREWAYGLASLGIATTIAQRVELIPPNSATAQMMQFISQAAIILLIIRAQWSSTSRRERVTTWFYVAVTVFLALGGGATAKVLYIAFAVFTGFYLGRKYLPLPYLLAGALSIMACIAVRGVMGDWRRAVWWGANQNVSPLEKSEILVELIKQSIASRGVLETIENGWTTVARRSTNIELLADVVRRTPDEIPYWRGATYGSLVGAFVPRLLWPDKPEKTLGQDFGHRYSYLSRGDLDTSINLPVLVEFYINFGDFGVLAGMAFIGVLFALLESTLNQNRQSIFVTAAAAPLLTQMFVMECDFSLQYGGLAMQFAALVALWTLFSWSYRLRCARLHARRLAAEAENHTIRTGFIGVTRYVQLLVVLKNPQQWLGGLRNPRRQVWLFLKLESGTGRQRWRPGVQTRRRSEASSQASSQASSRECAASRPGTTDISLPDGGHPIPSSRDESFVAGNR